MNRGLRDDVRTSARIAESSRLVAAREQATARGEVDPNCRFAALDLSHRCLLDDGQPVQSGARCFYEAEMRLRERLRSNGTSSERPSAPPLPVPAGPVYRWQPEVLGTDDEPYDLIIEPLDSELADYLNGVNIFRAGQECDQRDAREEACHG